MGMRSIAPLIVCMLAFSTAFAATSREVQRSQQGSSDKIPYSSLSPEERDILNQGEIGAPAYVIGGVIGTVVGLGIGQAIQGRYVPTGVIITAGEAASIALLEYGMSDCVAQDIGNAVSNETHNCSSAALTIGLAGFVGLRIWEIVDVWATPPSINSRYRNLRKHVEGGSNFTLLPAVNPQTHGVSGGAMAYQIRF
jgi:hypothetical protein